jgi:phosphoribosylformylglycinamidine synthase
VVGGNVSLYNEGPDGPIYPTPVVALVGELPDPAQVAGNAFVKEGDAIGLVGPFAPTLHGSELAKQRGQLKMGLPQPDVAAVAAACTIVRDAVRAGRLASAHDVSDGGLAVAIAECAIAGGIGCEANVEHLRERGCQPEEALFGEGTGGFLVSGDRGVLEELGAVLIGAVGGDSISIGAGDRSLSVSLADAESTWRSLDRRRTRLSCGRDDQSSCKRSHHRALRVRGIRCRQRRGRD